MASSRGPGLVCFPIERRRSLRLSDFCSFGVCCPLGTKRESERERSLRNTVPSTFITRQRCEMVFCVCPVSRREIPWMRAHSTVFSKLSESHSGNGGSKAGSLAGEAGSRSRVVGDRFRVFNVIGRIASSAGQGQVLGVADSRKRCTFAAKG